MLNINNTLQTYAVFLLLLVVFAGGGCFAPNRQHAVGGAGLQWAASNGVSHTGTPPETHFFVKPGQVRFQFSKRPGSYGAYVETKQAK